MRIKYIRRHIMIKKEFGEHILSGKKTTTIRLGKVVPKAREVIIHSGGRPIAKAVITGVTYKHVYELTDEDARKDGYDSAEQLIKDLEKLYGRSIDLGEIVTVIEFRIVKRFTDLNEYDIYMGLTPIDIAILSNRYLKYELSDEDLKIINTILRYKSIRIASLKLFGSLSKRWIIRRTLRLCLDRLVEKGIIWTKSVVNRGRDVNG
ncbi:MAG: ASCH domain-containing protein [Ignisphaera sp.]